MAKTQTILPIYLVIGEDRLMRDAVLSKMKSRLFSEGEEEFNSDTFIANKIEVDELNASLDTLPFGPDKRLVCIFEIEVAPKAILDSLASYAAQPNDSTVLLIFGSKLAKNTKLYKTVLAIDSKAFIDCTPKQKKELIERVIGMARTKQLNCDYNAAKKLVEYVGENTVFIDKELEKLQSILGVGATFGTSEVEELVSRSAEPTQWEVADAICNRDAKTALSYIARIADPDYISLYSAALYKLRQLVSAKALSSMCGNPQINIMQGLGFDQKKAWLARNLATQVNRFPNDVLEQALIEAPHIERALKSGGNPKIYFEKWVFQICS
jgi:DNA polymerase III subunit delta